VLPSAPEKGVEVAVEACGRAGVPLVVAGDGPERESLRVRAGGSDVSFAGVVAREQMGELRRGAALAVVPSRSAETFGLAAAEAMAAGVPPWSPAGSVRCPSWCPKTRLPHRGMPRRWRR